MLFYLVGHQARRHLTRRAAAAYLGSAARGRARVFLAYDPVLSVPVPPVPGRRVTDLVLQP
jgi:hypothetical protein